MRIIKYGFYGEDDAQKIFLKNYLNSITTVRFELDEEFCSRYRARNKKQVDDKFDFASQQGLLEYQHDVFFVGRDLDTHSDSEYLKKYNWFKEANPNAKNILFMIPVQCIEHWLWYLKIKHQNPNSTKNNPLETKPRKEAKQSVYGISEAVNAISNPIVERLTEKFEIEWLESRSASFRHFHQQVQAFLAQLPS